MAISGIGAAGASAYVTHDRLEHTIGITLTVEDGITTSITVGANFGGSSQELVNLLASLIQPDARGTYEPRLTSIVIPEPLGPEILQLAIDKFAGSFVAYNNPEEESTESTRDCGRLASLILAGGTSAKTIENTLLRYIAQLYEPSPELAQLAIELINGGSRLSRYDLETFICSCNYGHDESYNEILKTILNRKSIRNEASALIYWALKGNRVETAQFLIKETQNILIDYFRGVLPAEGQRPMYPIQVPLLSSIPRGNVSIFKSLMNTLYAAFEGNPQQIADFLNTPSGKLERTLAHAAFAAHANCSEGDHRHKIKDFTEIVEILLWNGASLDVFDTEMNTPRTLDTTCSISIHLQMYPPNPFISLMSGLTSAPLDQAPLPEDFEVYLLRAYRAPNNDPQASLKNVQHILNLGINPNKRHAKTGRTMLHTIQNLEAANSLITQGARIDAQDNQGMTPLHTTTSPEIAAKLIELGADIHAPDRYGRTPLHTTTSKEVARLLIDKGARLDARTHQGRTPLMTAAIEEDARYRRFFYFSDQGKNHRKRLFENSVFRLLMSKSSQSDVEQVDWNGNTALHYLVNAPELAIKLIQKQPNLANIENNAGITFYDEFMPIYQDKIPSEFNALIKARSQSLERTTNRLVRLLDSLGVNVIPTLFKDYPNHALMRTTHQEQGNGIKWTFSDGSFNLHLRAKDVEGPFIAIEMDHKMNALSFHVIVSILLNLMAVKSSLQSIFIPESLGTRVLSYFCHQVNQQRPVTLPPCGKERRSPPKMSDPADIAAFLILGNTPIASGANSPLMSLCGPTTQNAPYTPEQVYLAKTLIHKGANLNVFMNRTSLIQAAIARGSKELIEPCLASGRLRPDAQGKTPFHHALFPKPHYDILTLLTTKAPQWINTPDNEGTTPLQLAIINGDREGASLLVKAGAAIDATVAPLIQAAITRGTKNA